MSAAKVPAWKRLGLQLKAGGAGSEPAAAPSTTAYNSAQTPATPQTPALSNKRKYPADATPTGSALKFPRREDQPARPARRVSFSSGTKDGPTSRTPLAKTPKRVVDKAAKVKVKTKKPAKQSPPRAAPNLDKAIEYLHQWRDSRDSWKFNKNHTTMMIKYVYEDCGVLPAADMDTFYQYIRGMQGFSRVRLRQEAAEVRDKDEEAKTTGFAEGVKNAEGKQEKYEGMIAELKAQGGKYSETEFLSQKVDKFIAKRVVKRMRAEMILHVLEASQDEAAAKAPEVQVGEPAKEEVRKARPRKSRTAPVDDSSDESSSESESDTSSSGSDEDSDDEDSDDETSDESSDESSSDEESKEKSKDKSDAESDEDSDSDSSSSSDS